MVQKFRSGPTAKGEKKKDTTQRRKKHRAELRKVTYLCRLPGEPSSFLFELLEEACLTECRGRSSSSSLSDKLANGRVKQTLVNQSVYVFFFTWFVIPFLVEKGEDDQGRRGWSAALSPPSDQPAPLRY